LVSAALVSFYPAVAAISRLYTLDFPLASTVTFCIWCLIRTRYFAYFWRSVIFGLAAGLSVLTKGQAAIFLTGPVVYALAAGIVENRKEKKMPGKTIAGFIASLAIMVFLSSVWWRPQFGYMIDELVAKTAVSYVDRQVPVDTISNAIALPKFSRDWFLSYAYFSMNNVSPVLFFLFILGLVGLFRFNSKYKYVILLWWLGSYALLTLFEIKTDRYFLPAFPAMAVISGFFFRQFGNLLVRRIFIAIFLGFAAFQLIFLSYSPLSHRFIRESNANSIFYIVNPMTIPRIYGNPDNKSNFYELYCVSPTYSGINKEFSKIIDYLDREAASGIKKNVYLVFSSYTRGGHQDYLVPYLIRARNSMVKLYWPPKSRGDCLNCEQIGYRTHLRLEDAAHDYVLLLVPDRLLAEPPAELSSEKLSELVPFTKGDVRGQFSKVDSCEWSIYWGGHSHFFQAFLYKRSF